MKVEQRIGRIDRIGQQHAKIYVLNLCYIGSVEEIVYGRLLARLAQARLIVGTQQLSLLAVTEQDFSDLAAGVLSESDLLERTEARARDITARQRSMEMPAEELFEIYERQAAETAARPAPVPLDDVWATLRDSDYLRSLGCRVLDEIRRSIELNHVPGVQDGTVLTTSREVYERGLPGAIGALRFGTFGEPAFDNVLTLTGISVLPPGIRRIAVPIPGAGKDAELVEYIVMQRDKGVDPTPRLIIDMASLEGLAIDPSTPVPMAAAEQFAMDLSARARDEYRLLTAAGAVQDANERGGRAQHRLTRACRQLLQGCT
jgi:hypothetical protein